jgi:hypothetical protein
MLLTHLLFFRKALSGLFLPAIKSPGHPPKTVLALKQINPDYLIPMHCTGFRNMMAVQQECHRSWLCLPRARAWSLVGSSDATSD